MTTSTFGTSLKTFFCGADKQNGRAFKEHKVAAVGHVALIALITGICVLIKVQQIGGTFDFVVDDLKQAIGKETMKQLLAGIAIPADGGLALILLHVFKDGAPFIFKRVGKSIAQCFKSKSEIYIEDNNNLQEKEDNKADINENSSSDLDPKLDGGSKEKKD